MERNDDPLITALPCPFCGLKPIVIDLTYINRFFEGVTIGCVNKLCLISPKLGITNGIGKSKISAIRIWNRRQLNK